LNNGYGLSDEISRSAKKPRRKAARRINSPLVTRLDALEVLIRKHIIRNYIPD